MTNLNEIIKEAIRQYQKEIDIKFKTLVVTENLRVWRGRKVVSTKRWSKIIESKTFPEIFQYIPDRLDYGIMPEAKFGRQRTTQEYLSWSADYNEYLKIVKDQLSGKISCLNCILLSSTKDEIGVFDAMIKYYEKLGKQKTSFPCSVENIFRCPYNQDENNAALLNLGHILNILNKVINDTKQKTKEADESTIEVDFEAKTVKTRKSYNWRRIENFKELHKRYSNSSVRIRSKKDIFVAITEKEILEKIIEQYIQSLENQQFYYANKELQEDVEQLKNIKNLLIDDILSIDSFKELNELKNDETPFYVKTEETEDVDDEEDDYKNFSMIIRGCNNKELEEHMRRKKMGFSGKCSTCNRFATIACANCSVWMCEQHWQQHGSTVHNFVLEEKSKTS